MDKDSKSFIYAGIAAIWLDSFTMQEFQSIAAVNQWPSLKPIQARALQKNICPIVSTDGSTVTAEVGSTHHPMTGDHAIEWIYLETKHGGKGRDSHPMIPPKPASPSATMSRYRCTLTVICTACGAQ